MADTLTIGLVSISDRASAGVYEDKGLPGLQEWLTAALQSPWKTLTRLIPDEQAIIERTLVELVDIHGCSLVFTTGAPDQRRAMSHPRRPWPSRTRYCRASGNRCAR